MFSRDILIWKRSINIYTFKQFFILESEIVALGAICGVNMTKITKAFTKISTGAKPGENGTSYLYRTTKDRKDKCQKACAELNTHNSINAHEDVDIKTGETNCSCVEKSEFYPDTWVQKEEGVSHCIKNCMAVGSSMFALGKSKTDGSCNDQEECRCRCYNNSIDINSCPIEQSNAYNLHSIVNLEEKVISFIYCNV